MTTPESAAPEPVYGKPFHGWSCECDECQGYDERGEPRPGEAPRTSAAPRWQDDVDEAQIKLYLSESLGLLNVGYYEYGVEQARHGYAVELVRVTSDCIEVTVQDCEPWRGGRPRQGEKRSYKIEYRVL